MNTKELVFIDLSSIAYPIWHMSQSEPDPNSTSQKVLARVRATAADHAYVAICCDSGRSFRKDISAEYKANRPESDAPLQHQIALAKKALAADGFPVWTCDNCEADDVLATAVMRTIATPNLTALIVSADKDLLQLVGTRVEAMSVRDGAKINAEGVGLKFGVRPEQMRDYLSLVGDTSDNIKGAKGIGPKKAAELLAKFGTLDELYMRLKETGGAALGLAASVVTALKEFEPNLPLSRKLITLKTDCEIPFEEILNDRVAKAIETFDDFGHEDEASDEAGDAPLPFPAPSVPTPAEPVHGSEPQPAPVTALARRESTDIAAPVEWGLQPATMRDARTLAKDMFDSRMFSAYGTPAGVLSTVMVGRELGLPAMASLRSIHNIEGRHALSASLMAAIVLKSGLAEYFEPISFSETEATYETKRRGARNPVRLTHTIEMGRTAWPKAKPDWEKSFMASGWGRNATDMLVARAQSRLARMVYPDLLAGLYTPDELAEVRESLVA